MTVKLYSHPGAVVGHAAAAGQAGVKVGDPVGAADRSVLVDFTAAVDVTTSGQVPLGHGESRSGRCKFKAALKHLHFMTHVTSTPSFFVQS